MKSNRQLAQQLTCCLGCLPSILECLAHTPAPLHVTWFPNDVSLEGAGNGSSTCCPYTHVEDPD